MANIADYHEQRGPSVACPTHLLRSGRSHSPILANDTNFLDKPTFVQPRNTKSTSNRPVAFERVTKASQNPREPQQARHVNTFLGNEESNPLCFKRDDTVMTMRLGTRRNSSTP